MTLVRRLLAWAAGRRPPASRTLALDVGGERFAFATHAEFELALRPRTEVSATALRRLSKLSEEELRAEQGLCRSVHKRLTTGLLRAIETGTPIERLWREIDVSRISEEHQWQELFYALGDPLQVADEYRRAALVRYLQYLKARRDTLGEVLKEVQAQNGTMVVQRATGGGASGGAVDDLTYTAMQRSPEYSRLPPRHPVELVLVPGDSVTLFLAHRRMRLQVREDGTVLTDDSGLQVPIQPGRFVVGRSTECDVVLHNAPADVSRKHLLIEADAQEVRLTDLSSHGTYVTKRALTHTQTRH
jgi:hypothetical protein